MRKRNRLDLTDDSDEEQGDRVRTRRTPLSRRLSTSPNASVKQSSTTAVADPGTRSIKGQMTPTMEDAMNLQNRISMIENRQQQQQRDRLIETSNNELMTRKIEAIETASKDLVRRIGSLESLDRDQNIQEMQAQILEIKQELAITRNEHQKQMSQAMSLVSSAFGSAATDQKKNGNSKKGQIYDHGAVAEIEQMMLLPLLQKMDFRDPRHLKALKKIEGYEINMSMFHPDEKYNKEGIAYLVRARGPFSEYLITSNRKNPFSAEKSYWNSREWNKFPTVLELSAYQKDTVTTPAFPKYVWEIGEIYIRRLTKETNKYTEQSTGYHLVVDITMPEKSVWMINRCVEHDICGRIVRNDTKATDPFWHPFATVGNDICDAAVVFANINDWGGLDTKLGQFLMTMLLVKKTARNMQPTPTFTKPILGEVMNAIQKGWQAMGPK